MAIRMLKKHMDNHDQKAKEFITEWHEERKNHGGDHIYDQDIDLKNMKKSKEQIIEDMRIKGVEKLIKAIPAPVVK